MVILRVGNNYTKVETPDRGELKIISNALKLRPLGYEYSPKFKSHLWDGYISLLSRGKFLSGLLSIVTFYLKLEGVRYKIVDERIDPCVNLLPVELSGYTIRDYQWDAIASAIENKRGVIGAATNAGKTLIAIGLTQALGVKTLFMTHREELFRQTLTNFQEV